MRKEKKIKSLMEFFGYSKEEAKRVLENIGELRDGKELKAKYEKARLEKLK